MSLCECGCGTAVAPGKRFVRFHYRTPRRYDPATRYVEEDRGYQTRCWIWQGPIRNRYGSLWEGGKQVYAHRWMYEQRHGPIPAGLVLDHLCREHHCINPDHLEVVTQTVNMRRGSNAILTADQAREIRAVDAAHLLQRRVDGKWRRAPGWWPSLAARYGLTTNGIKSVVYGRNWRGV